MRPLPPLPDWLKLEHQVAHILTQQEIHGGYEHPWYQYLNKPNPPTQQQIEKAKFIDKTYHWDRDNSVRLRNKRAAG